MGITERIKEIESEMARTQKNKATNYHLGTLKAKLAKLRNDLLVEQSGGSGSGGAGEGFDVARLGDARIALIGFPSVGKSSLLNQLTATQSEAAAYEFTTLTCIPGTMKYKGSRKYKYWTYRVLSKVPRKVKVAVVKSLPLHGMPMLF